MAGHVFISYQHGDKSYVDKLAEFLTKEKIPVWYDFSMIPGDQYVRVLEQQIDACVAMIVVLTPEAATSDWVHKEISYATATRKLLLPIELRTTKEMLSLASLHRDLVHGERMPSTTLLARLRSLFPAGEGRRTTATGRAAVGSPGSTPVVPGHPMYGTPMSGPPMRPMSGPPMRPMGPPPMPRRPLGPPPAPSGEKAASAESQVFSSAPPPRVSQAPGHAARGGQRENRPISQLYLQSGWRAALADRMESTEFSGCGNFDPGYPAAAVDAFLTGLAGRLRAGTSVSVTEVEKFSAVLLPQRKPRHQQRAYRALDVDELLADIRSVLRAHEHQPFPAPGELGWPDD